MNYYQLAIDPEACIAGNATIIGSVSIAKDCTILFNATLRGDYDSHIEIGEGSNVQENCCVHLGADHPCTIGKGVTIGHGAVVHGCTIGDGTLVGMRATVMDDAVIGKNCLVAAGALVTGGTIIEDGMLVVGSPAKAKRPLSAEEIEGNRVAAEGYVAIGKDLVENGIIHAGDKIPADIMTIAIR
ncbi:MAG: gamma carbonic anhydrase family protein [Raoultibacter sp.]